MQRLKKSGNAAANDALETLKKEAELASEFLSGDDLKKTRFDIDQALYLHFDSITKATQAPGNKTVTGRMLITEAIIDLIHKYEAGEGKYPFKFKKAFIPLD